MTKKSDQFIAIPENLDYRATDFYDMEEDELKDLDDKIN